MMASSKAWILELGGGLLAAIGERQLQHLVYRPSLHPVPRTPAHASRIMFWGEGILPLVDMARMIQGGSHSAGDLLAAVTVYQSSPRSSPEYGALALIAPPRRIEVNDKDACPLPMALAPWDGFLFNACFDRGGQPVPVLALNQVFPANTV